MIQSTINMHLWSLIAVAILAVALVYLVLRIVILRIKCRDESRLFKEKQSFDELIIDTLPFSIMLGEKRKDLDDVAFNWKTIKWNIAALKLLGNVKDKRLKELLTPASYELLRKQIIEALSSKKNVIKDLPLTVARGMRRFDALSFVRIFELHNRSFLLLIIADITELQTAKSMAEETDEQRADFLANMSNDIDASLDKIWSACQSVIDAGKDEELGEYIDVLVTNISIFLKRINDIISLSEVESSAIEHYDVAKLEVISLLLEQQVKLENQLKVLKKDANIEIEFLEAYQKMLVYQDKGHFTQIMDNLLSNAAKCTTFGSIKFGVIAGLNYYLFFVKDTGIGISQERIEMLFSGDDEVKDSSVDFALGLSISKKIVMTQQGQIGMISDKDDGSLFWVFFPYSATFELGAVSDDEKRELYLITEKIIRCDELNGLNLENPF